MRLRRAEANVRCKHPTRPLAFFCRAGIKEADESALFWQPHAGVGVLWKRRSGLGIQLDYAVAPLGDLGNCHYATLSVRPGKPVRPR